MQLAFPPCARRPKRRPCLAVSERVSDGDLIQRIGIGDRNAFEALYRRFARPVFGLALRRLGDRGRAEDALQETFTSVWRSAATYSPERGPGAPWLYAVARNAIVDRSRGRAEIPARPARGGDAGARARPSTRRPRGSPGASTCALRELPEHERTVLELAYWSGLSQSEVATLPEHPARHGQDANAERAHAPRRRARRGDADEPGRPPDLRELVGDDLPQEELRAPAARARAARPAQARRPSFRASSRSRPSPTATVALLPRRHWRPLAALAAALALAAFGAGWLAASAGDSGERAVPGDRLQRPDAGRRRRRRTPSRRSRSARSTRPATGRCAMTVRGLPELPTGQHYELWLTRKGELAASCGTFRTRGRHRRVPERAVPPPPATTAGSSRARATSAAAQDDEV